MTKPQDRKPFIIWQSEDKEYRIIAVPMPSTGNARRAGEPETDRWQHVLEARERDDALGQPVYETADELSTYRTATAMLVQDYANLVKGVMG